MTSKSLIPVLDSDSGLTRYLREIRRIPLLEPQEEQDLAKLWRDEQDLDAAHRLVTSHLRLVAKIAMGFRGYGLPVNELISEGNIGLMQAVKKFDPEKGFRLATYAMWWIRASIQEYILRSWSLVKMGTTSAQKKLFFNLRRLKGEIQAIEEGDLTPEHLKHIATKLDVTEREVIDMNRRMLSHDYSTNSPLKIDGDGEWQDFMPDDTIDQETALGEQQELQKRSALLGEAMSILNDREKQIIISRRLNDTPETLEELSVKYGISRERIRQIEVRAYEKIRDYVLNAAEDDLKAAS
ncbi:MAG: RNA polymerase sigma factor RpoH [Alphaproteobacteria bacterium]|nr:RNA polymerase sigma factor RpoH [Alphaproteobacteria bacterium]